ncbi:hypothetical protein [Bradyrhizobium cenepequi]|uniref:hypothetical protein n=1 Tax=Bradyrhizobium cenepequi TaxID=2821403 RepID=UPI001CE36B06|nr:hypothetical protein [Bradyrhizobium cenepequi]MCA6106971.1 hypothetical protein [Bradyrhizobium cenepequi]
MQEETQKPAIETAESKIPDQLKGLFCEPPFLEGEDPNLYRGLLAAVIEERKPVTVTDWIAVNDLVTKLWEERVFRRASNALIRGGMIKAVAYYLEQVRDGELDLGRILEASMSEAIGYFSRDPKERNEVRSRLDQYGISQAELHAKAAQDNSDALQMFERMIAARERGRRKLSKEDHRRRREDRREATKGSE